MLHPHWTRQRRGGAWDGMSESDSDATDKETGEANLTANMPPKGTTGIKCRGKGQPALNAGERAAMRSPTNGRSKEPE